MLNKHIKLCGGCKTATMSFVYLFVWWLLWSFRDVIVSFIYLIGVSSNKTRIIIIMKDLNLLKQVLLWFYNFIYVIYFLFLCVAAQHYGAELMIICCLRWWEVFKPISKIYLLPNSTLIDKYDTITAQSTQTHPLQKVQICNKRSQYIN